MSAVSFDWLSEPPEVDDEKEPKRFYGVVSGTLMLVMVIALVLGVHRTD